MIAHWIGLPIEKVGYVNSTVFPAGLSFLVEDDVFMDWGGSAQLLVPTKVKIVLQDSDT